MTDFIKKHWGFVIGLPIVIITAIWFCLDSNQSKDMKIFAVMLCIQTLVLMILEKKKVKNLVFWMLPSGLFLNEKLISIIKDFINIHITFEGV